MLLLNAFSVNMLSDFPSAVKFTEMGWEQAADLLVPGFESAVGHSGTADIFGAVLGGLTVPMARTTVTLKKGDKAVLGQYRGPRLPEGATSLPPDGKVVWYLVEVL